MHDNILRLPTIQMRRLRPALILPLVAAPGRLALPRRRPSPLADPLVIRRRVIRERRQDGRRASLRLEERWEEEGWGRCGRGGCDGLEGC